jgi:deoxyribodipyrimidine photolyase-related protein
VRVLGRTVHSIELDAPGNTPALATELARAVAQLKPERLVMTEAGEWRVQETPVPADGLLARFL